MGARTVVLDLGDRAVALTVRRHLRARRLILRIAPDGAGVVVTIPAQASFDDAVGLARRSTAWIARRLDALSPRVPFVPGSIIPVLGQDHVICHRPENRTEVRHEAGEIVVTGPSESVARKVKAWLHVQARNEIAARVPDKAAQLGRAPGRVSVRDTRSRWGSCSAEGNLSFSWRLIMAPGDVLDYVVAHEVAHLAVRNHRPRFWWTVTMLVGDIEQPRAWLRRFGPDLHRYG